MRITPEPTEPPPRRSRLLLAVPNLLTLTRLALGIVFPLLPVGWRLTAMLAAAATEFLDGQIARLLKAPSTTGRILDPIADKVFVLFVLATLLAEETLRPWQLLLVMPRDIVVTAGAFWFAVSRGLHTLTGMAPSILGKLTTAAQFLLLLVVVAANGMNLSLLVITSFLSTAAAIDYAWRLR